MKRKSAKGLMIILMSLVLGLSGVSNAEAKLTLYTPDKMLQTANTVLVGTVTALKTTGAQQTCDIKVEKVIKGRVSAKSIKATAPYSAAPTKGTKIFPPRGSKVFLALKRDGKAYRLAADRNGVAVVEKGHVAKLHAGSKVFISKKAWLPSSYVKYYDNYYQRYLKSTAKPAVVPPTQTTGLEISENNNGETVYIKPGETVQVKLISNPSTGYKWMGDGPDKSVVSVKESYLEPGGNLVGAAGKQCWTITGINPGSTSLNLNYARPWESVQPVKTFKLIINVSNRLAEKDNGKQITLNVGETIEVGLVSNGTTGYSWEYKTKPNMALVSVEDDFISPPEDLIGAAGLQTWKITGLSPGTTKLDLWYIQPWIDPRQPAGTYKLVIQVCST